MSALRPGSMRGWREATHVLLLLLLVTSLTGTVLSQSDDEDTETETHDEEQSNLEPTEDGDTVTPESPPTESGATSITEPNPNSVEGENSQEHGSTDETYTSIFEDAHPLASHPGRNSDPSSQPDTEALSPTIILIPVVLAVLIISMIVGGILIHRRCIKKVNHADHTKEDLYLDGSSTEKVPMPMFEEDVPSVLELEMEDLDQWMSNDD
ncbi:transmembrane protein 154 isoform X1 [Genypterus blacodes]|uniref:transmembrane protein 154 isoform X1 n=1 Tax=Genypterus blacodes TaxID=154954 RepID=UPI003F767CD2